MTYLPLVLIHEYFRPFHVNVFSIHLHTLRLFACMALLPYMIRVLFIVHFTLFPYLFLQYLFSVFQLQSLCRPFKQLSDLCLLTGFSGACLSWNCTTAYSKYRISCRLYSCIQSTTRTDRNVQVAVNAFIVRRAIPVQNKIYRKKLFGEKFNSSLPDLGNTTANWVFK